MRSRKYEVARMNENIELMMPIKVTPYEHQKNGFSFVCDKFGVFDEQIKSSGVPPLSF